MKKEDVPQQGGLNAGCLEVNYAIDSNGQYTLETSAGWEVKNVALRQAWEAIDDQLRDMLVEIKAGKKSSLGYHMVKAQMDLALLAQYSGIARWRVKRHLKPAVFAKLNMTTLTIYSELFGVTISELKSVPDQPALLLHEIDQSEGDDL